MSPVLRALGAAALAVGQAALTVTDNGTYLATVTLDSVPVKLIVDTVTSGVWVKCSALDGPSCADGITTSTAGYSKKRLQRFDKNVPRKTRRFKEVIIAGQTFNGFDGYVFYDQLPEVDASIQGVLGLKKISSDYEQASMYLDGQVSTVAIQVGQSSSDSKLSLDTMDSSLLTKKGLNTPLPAATEMTCFQVPLANGSSECTSSAGSVFYDPGLPYIGLVSTTLDTLERRFLYTCKAVGPSYAATGYTCDASVKLPRLTMQIGSYEFFLDPSEYTVPIQGSSQVKLLVGDYPSMYTGWAFGAPFLRKYPYVYNTSGYSTLYCREGATCTKVVPKSSTSSPSYSGGGGYGSGYSNGGGGGSSPTYGVDVETRRKRNKIYLTIGVSIGGIALLALCGCICKGCSSKDTENTNEDGSKTKDDANLQLVVGAPASDDSDDSEGDGTKKPKETVAVESKAVKSKDKTESRRRKDGELSSGESSDASSSYDSESSEESRRERRRRRRRRRARRRERELRQQAMDRQSEATTTNTGTASVGGDNGEETPYVAASSPKNGVRW